MKGSAAICVMRAAILAAVIASLPKGHSATQGFAATVQPLATEAALDAMRKGGNAVDGAVAAALTLAVVDTHNSGLGGGLFMVIRKPDGSFVAIDGRETAPRLTTPDLFMRNGKPVPELIRQGPLAVAVPGAVAALSEAAESFGRTSFAIHAQTAAVLARNGFVPDSIFLSRRKQWSDRLRNYPATASVLLAQSSDGRVRQRDLADSLTSLAEQGPNWFYKGPYAARADSWMGTNGGVLNAADFASYQTKRREPLRTRYRGYEIVGFPPPSSGGVHVAQILAILEQFDLKSLGDNTADFYHLVAEAMKLAFADRAYWLGDPDFTRVPRGLVERNYGRELARRIDPRKAGVVAGHGSPPGADTNFFERHTTHFSVSDSAGWWVACTATINNTFGSLVMIPGTGIVLNNEMDDFALPGAPNSFGLVGSDANAVAPGKRPLSSMSPTIILKGGKPVFSVGAAGGPTIISQVVLAVIRHVDFGQSASNALAAPRIHHQWRPDALRVEASVPKSVQRELERRGHKVEVTDVLGTAQALSRDESGNFAGAHDPRVPGKAAGL